MANFQGLSHRVFPTAGKTAPQQVRIR